MNSDKSQQEILTSLGVSIREMRVYKTLLAHGSASIRQIAHHTSLNRGTIYTDLKNLIALGLVGYRKKGARQSFFAENPYKLMELLSAKEQQLQAASHELPDYIQSLQNQKSAEPEESNVRFYEDDEGVAVILRDVLATLKREGKQEYYVYSSRPLREYMYRFFPNFTRQRIKENIRVKVIAIGSGGEKAELADRKWLAASNESDTSSYVIIYANKVATISLSASNMPYGVVIEDPGTAATQRLLFTTLWNSL